MIKRSGKKLAHQATLSFPTSLQYPPTVVATPVTLRNQPTEVQRPGVERTAWKGLRNETTVDLTGQQRNGAYIRRNICKHSLAPSSDRNLPLIAQAVINAPSPRQQIEHLNNVHLILSYWYSLLLNAWRFTQRRRFGFVKHLGIQDFSYIQQYGAGSKRYGK